MTVTDVSLLDMTFFEESLSKELKCDCHDCSNTAHWLTINFPEAVCVCNYAERVCNKCRNIYLSNMNIKYKGGIHCGYCKTEIKIDNKRVNYLRLVIKEFLPL